jgi:hypothetical protein
VKSAIINFSACKGGVYFETKKEIEEQACRLEQGQNDWPEVTVEPATDPFYPHSPEVGSADAGIGAV